MNREINTSEFQKRINQAVGHVAKKITKMVIHYDDNSTIVLEDGGRVGRTGNWDTHCSICGEKSDSSESFLFDSFSFLIFVALG